jgi:hypothetical protein
VPVMLPDWARRGPEGRSSSDARVARIAIQGRLDRGIFISSPSVGSPSSRRDGVAAGVQGKDYGHDMQ